MVDKATLTGWMKDHVVEVEFEKTDGSTRRMACTLREDTVVQPKGTGAEKPSDLVTVWSVDDNGWRSFYINKLKTVRVLDGQ